MPGYAKGPRMKEAIAKSMLEKATGNRMWIEKPANLADVRDTIKMMRPTPATLPLIRIGGGNDGGYLVPDAIDDISWLVSPGVADNVSFDLGMAERGMKVIMADASVDGPPVAHEAFSFQKKYLGSVDNDDFIRLDTMAAPIDSDALLQMDIEGDEYIVLLDSSTDTLNKFRVMILELHHLTNLFSNRYNRIIRATIAKLLQTHRIVHIHPNNVGGFVARGDLEVPHVMEFTLLRKDYFDPSPQFSSYPHPLDEPCNGDLPEVVLPKVWWPAA